MDNKFVERKIDELIDEIIAGGVDKLGVIGVRSGGEALAKVIRDKVADRTPHDPPIGMLDITLYRDDFDIKDGLKQPVIRATEVPFSIDGMRRLLVDDVLFTGRTIRAALDALCDLGRPSKIDLCVLVDRGFRELPIRPYFVGATLETNRQDLVEVKYDAKKGWSVKIEDGIQ
jgi:pyrimidine operon attenuation protein/uracil phosphoribosyltransferase